MKTKPPTKRERDAAFLAHNVPQFLKSIERVQKAARHLDCTLAECALYGSMVAPAAKKGARK